MIDISKHSFFLDKFAVSTSALCAIHCLFLPIILSVFPAVGSTIFGQESFHLWLLILVIPPSLVALFIGCRQHKNWLVAILGVSGISILIFTAIYGHDVLGHDGERTATLIGVSVIAIRHLQNFRLCRQQQCSY